MFGAAPPPQNEDDAVPPAQPLRVAKVAALLGDGQLPRGVRHVRRQRDPLQPRVAAPRRDLRHPQDHPRRGPDQGRAAGQALPRQPRRQARLGLRPRLRRGDVADAPGRRARRLRGRHRRDALGARVLRARLRARRARTGSSYVEIDPRYFRPPRSTRCCGDAVEGARRSSAGSRRSASSELVEIMVDADVAALEDQLAGKVTRYSHEVDRERRQPDPDFWDGKRVAVTGGAGFLGKPTVRHARRARRRGHGDPLGRARPARPRGHARGARAAPTSSSTSPPTSAASATTAATRRRSPTTT